MKTGDVFDLSGPFAESIKSFDTSHLRSFGVKIRSDRDSPHPLNPVRQLKRIVSLGHQGSTDALCTEALLLLGAQFLEVFTVLSETSSQQNSPEKTGHAGILTRRLKSVASSAQHAIHVKKLKDRPSIDIDDETLAGAHAPEEIEKAQDLLKDHVLSISIALPQVLKVRLHGAEIVVYYHPNDLKKVKMGKFLAGSMQFSFCTDTPQEAQSIVEAIKEKVDKFNQAALFLNSDIVLPSEMNILAVTRPISAEQAQSDKDEELVVGRDVPWGSPVLTPDWGPQGKGSSTQPLWVYLETPLGHGKAEIKAAIVAKYAKNGHASFFVGVKHPQHQSQLLASTVSRLQRISTHAREAEELEDDESDDSWQPEASESNPSTGTTKSLPSRFSNTGRKSMINGRSGRHIRLHCSATYIDNCRFAAAKAKPQTSPVPSFDSGSHDDLLKSKQIPILVTLLVLGSLALLTGFKQIAFLSLNVAIAFMTYIWSHSSKTQIQPVSRPEPAKQSRDCAGWKVVLVRAELVKDESWLEYGDSMVAKMDTDDSEEAVDSRKQVVSQQYGMSDDEVNRYMLAFQDDEALAHQKMAATYEWRKKMRAEDVLHQKAPHFKFFKNMFHHALLGTTKDGHPIWFMKIGDMKTGFKTFKNSSLTSDDLARHVALCMDYMYQVIETAPLPNGRALWILDLKGMGLTDMGGEAFDLGKQIAGMLSAHWPERLYRAFVINMPGFFSVLWKLIEPMMAASTRRKIRLLRGKENMIKEMTEEMSIEDIPVVYGGQLEDVYDAKAEKDFWKLVESH